MAGGKETPRQKMIGMMYLVLTALLALNVSTAVLEKFAIIDDTLSKLVVENNTTNQNLYNAIKTSNFAGPRVEKSKEQADQVHALTEPMIKYLEDLKKQMATSKDGKAIERAELVLNTNNSEEIMINHNKPEVGESYEKKLTAYVSDLNKIMGIQPPFKPLTRTAKDYDEFKEGHNKDKGFLEFAFEGVPTMAAIATVTEIQSEILKYEAVALDSLSRRVEAKTYKVDQLVPMVQSLSNTLVAGQTFEGDLFVAGSASGVNPEMFFGNSPVKVEDKEIGNGIKIKMGTIKFPVRPASNYDANGIAKSTFHVKIKLPGNPVPLDKDIEYRILRPSPRFASDAASSLYINCGNEQSVTIPGLTDLSGLNLSVAGGEGTATKLGPGKFVILPTRPQCHVSVLMDGQPIYTETFKTKDVPIPIARVMYGNSAYSDDLGLPPGTANIRVEPEILQSDFLQNNKKDANYIVNSFTLMVRGSPVPIKGGSLSLAPYNLKSGDSFSITNVKVSRSTYDGKTVEVLGSKMSKVIKIK